MDVEKPVIIETVTTTRHDIRAEVIEHVARLLCRADGKDPDRDVRISPEGNMYSVHITGPTGLWTQYRGKAEERLRGIFK